MIFIWFACVVAAMGPARVAPPSGPPCTPSGYFQRFQMAAVRWVRSVCSGASSRRLMVSFRVAQCPSKVRLDLETTRKMVPLAYTFSGISRRRFQGRLLYLHYSCRILKTVAWSFCICRVWPALNFIKDIGNKGRQLLQGMEERPYTALRNGIAGARVRFAQAMPKNFFMNCGYELLQVSHALQGVEDKSL